MQTRVTRLFKIQHPIVLPGMSWISKPKLVAAVCNAGGLGILASGPLSAVETAMAIKEIRSLTDKPFGIGTTLMMPVGLLAQVRLYSFSLSLLPFSLLPRPSSPPLSLPDHSPLEFPGFCIAYPYPAVLSCLFHQLLNISLFFKTKSTCVDDYLRPHVPKYFHILSLLLPVSQPIIGRQGKCDSRLGRRGARHQLQPGQGRLAGTKSPRVRRQGHRYRYFGEARCAFCFGGGGREGRVTEAAIFLLSPQLFPPISIYPFKDH